MNSKSVSVDKLRRNKRQLSATTNMDGRSLGWGNFDTTQILKVKNMGSPLNAKGC